MPQLLWWINLLVAVGVVAVVFVSGSQREYGWRRILYWIMRILLIIIPLLIQIKTFDGPIPLSIGGVYIVNGGGVILFNELLWGYFGKSKIKARGWYTVGVGLLWLIIASLWQNPKSPDWTAAILEIGMVLFCVLRAEQLKKLLN